jgi:hypothetical protein
VCPKVYWKDPSHSAAAIQLLQLLQPYNTLLKLAANPHRQALLLLLLRREDISYYVKAYTMSNVSSPPPPHT